MAWPSIGSESFITLGGMIQHAGYTSRVVTRPGVAGIAYQLTGLTGEPFDLHPIADCATAQALTNVKKHFCYTLPQSLVTVVDDSLVSWTNLWLVRAVPVMERKMTPVGGGIRAGTWILQLRVTLQPTATSY